MSNSFNKFKMYCDHLVLQDTSRGALEVYKKAVSHFQHNYEKSLLLYPKQSETQTMVYDIRRKSKGGLEVYEEDSVRLLSTQNQLFLLANVAIAMDPTKDTAMLR
jgi:hypothetical protein